jgi:tRNA(fMet)-specific endonuclease VapC
MSRVILDTDVWSFVFKGDTRAGLYSIHLIGQTPCITFASVGELYLWAELRNWGESRKAGLSRAIQQQEVIGWDDATSQHWARIRAERQRIGRPIAAQDAWIAACAVRHDLPLVTHNAGHFADISDLTLVTAQP